MKETHYIVVGNVGTVHVGPIYKEAKDNYETYVNLSKEGHGRFAGESVTWLINGDIFKEYTPPEEESPEVKKKIKDIQKKESGAVLEFIRGLIDAEAVNHFATIAQLLDILQRRSEGEVDYKLPLVHSKDGRTYRCTTPDIDAIREASAQGEIDLPMWLGDRVNMMEELGELGFTIDPLYSQLKAAIDTLIPKKEDPKCPR